MLPMLANAGARNDGCEDCECGTGCDCLIEVLLVERHGNPLSHPCQGWPAFPFYTFTPADCHGNDPSGTDTPAAEYPRNTYVTISAPPILQCAGITYVFGYWIITGCLQNAAAFDVDPAPPIGFYCFYLPDVTVQTCANNPCGIQLKAYYFANPPCPDTTNCPSCALDDAWAPSGNCVKPTVFVGTPCHPGT